MSDLQQTAAFYRQQAAELQVNLDQLDQAATGRGQRAAWARDRDRWLILADELDAYLNTEKPAEDDVPGLF